MTKILCRDCGKEIDLEMAFANTECPICHATPLLRPRSDGGWEIGSSRDYIPTGGLCTGGMMSGAGGINTHTNFCPHCKTLLAVHSNFCHNCGYDLKRNFGGRS